MPFLLVTIAVHFWGTRKNKRKAREWASAYAPTLQSEFAVVGFSGIQKPVARDGDDTSTEVVSPESLLKEKSAQEYTTYATGRRNLAFMDLSVKLPKRYNPMVHIMEHVFSFFFESWPAPSETLRVTAYSFDGKEKDLVPVPAGDTSVLKVGNSTYDGFIWAVVHKGYMRKFRQDRYDASMTFTRDNAKLPPWVTVMTESAEITDALLTPELITAIEKAGDALEYLIVTDQPVDKPAK